MALPSSGPLELSRIGSTDGANSVGVVTPYSLGQLCKLAAKDFVWDGGFFWNNPKISSFYGYPGYGYKYGSPDILHDFGLSNRFPSSSSQIIDTSGNGRTGTFVTGTGNGSATNIAGYNTAFPGNIGTTTSSQYSIRLNDVVKYGGTQTFMWIVWFRCTNFQTQYNGLIACEGRSGGTPIGQSLYISNVGGTTLNYQRFNGTSGSAQTISLTFGSGGVPSFVLGKWYMAVAINNSGANMQVGLFTDGGSYANSTNSTSSVTTDASWGVFAGLRYNNWLDGNIGYVACYPTNIGSAYLFDLYYNTRVRYEI